MDTSAIQTAFERVYVVNLDRRQDRMAQFRAMLPPDWPFLQPERFRAVDGQLAEGPDWWKQGNGAWGCYRSHARILEECLNEQVNSVLILEDDALFPADFAARVTELLVNLPDDWEMLYLGGQHLGVPTNPPRRINEYVYAPYNVNRTHAFAVRGRPMLLALYKHLHSWKEWLSTDHVDHHLGRLHERRQHRIYCPARWLVGQAPGKSNICGRMSDERFWPAAETEAVRAENAALCRSAGTAFVGFVGACRNAVPFRSAPGKQARWFLRQRSAKQMWF